MAIEMHIAKVGSSRDIDQPFSGPVGDIELVDEVVLVAVLVLVLLREGRKLLHAVLYVKKLSVIFPNRVLFFFYFFARTPPYMPYIEKKSASFLDK